MAIVQGHTTGDGRFNRFSKTAFGGLVAGETNIISNAVATVTGGNLNAATGPDAAVTGGRGNTPAAGGNFSGGNANTASGLFGSVSGGFINTASGVYASVAWRPSTSPPPGNPASSAAPVITQISSNLSLSAAGTSPTTALAPSLRIRPSPPDRRQF